MWRGGRLCGAERFDTILTPPPYPGLFVKRVLPCLSVFTHTFLREALAFDISPCPPLPTFQPQPWSFLITSVWVGKNGWFNTGLTRILNKKVNQTSKRLMNIFFKLLKHRTRCKCEIFSRRSVGKTMDHELVMKMNFDEWLCFCWISFYKRG